MYFTILERDDQNCAASLGIANVLNEYDKRSEAVEIYKLLANSEPNSATGINARVNQGHIAMWDSNYDLAANLYKSALQQKPDDLDISLYLSKAYFRMKDFTNCRTLLESIAPKHTDDARVKFNLAQVLYNIGRNHFNLPQRSVADSNRAVEDLE